MRQGDFEKQSGRYLTGIRCAVLSLMLCLTGNALAADDTSKHFAVSALCGATSESILHYKTELGTRNRLLFATAMGSIPGLAKEIADSAERDNFFDESDLAADIAGAFAGALVSHFFNNAVQIRIQADRQRTAFVFAYGF